MLHRRHKDLAVAYFSGPRGLDDGINRRLHLVIGDDHLDLHLGQEVDDVLGTAVELGMAFLPTEPLHFRDGQARDPDFG